MGTEWPPGLLLTCFTTEFSQTHVRGAPRQASGHDHASWLHRGHQEFTQPWLCARHRLGSQCSAQPRCSVNIFKINDQESRAKPRAGEWRTVFLMYRPALGEFRLHPTWTHDICLTISGFHCDFTYSLFITLSPRFAIIQPLQEVFLFAPFGIEECKDSIGPGTSCWSWGQFIVSYLRWE